MKVHEGILWCHASSGATARQASVYFESQRPSHPCACAGCHSQLLSCRVQPALLRHHVPSPPCTQWRKHLTLEIDQLSAVLMPPGVRALRQVWAARPGVVRRGVHAHGCVGAPETTRPKNHILARQTRKQSSARAGLALYGAPRAPNTCRHSFSHAPLPQVLFATVVEVLLYLTPLHRADILCSLVTALNSTFSKFMLRNPHFKGSVSILAHSLGSMLCHDILCNQPPWAYPAASIPHSPSAPVSHRGRPPS